jgi:hypothetical protein
MALSENEAGMKEKRRACFSCEVCDPDMLPDLFFPRPIEKDRRERLESIDTLGSSPVGMELFMLTGG